MSDDACCRPMESLEPCIDSSLTFHYRSSMLSTPEASRAVFEDAAGTLAGVSEGKFIIDCATLAESDMKRMCRQVQEKGG